MRRLASDTSTAVDEARVELDGEPVAVRTGEAVAIGLLAAGHRVFSRSVKYHRARGPYCLEGACGHCLMRVDGVPNVFTCQAPAQPGMRLERQNAFPSATLDVFSAIDLFFPKGFDHHHFLASVPGAREVMLHVARQLAGLGRPPDAQAATPLGATHLETEVAVVGAGPAGLAAAEALAERDVPFLVCDREHARTADPARALSGTTVLGVYRDAPGFVLPSLRVPPDLVPRLVLLRAKRLVLATGGHATLLPFEDNDLPGVFSASAAHRLLAHGVVVGNRPVLVGHGPVVEALGRVLRSAGVDPVLELVLDTTPGGGQVAALRAHGDPAVEAFTYRDVTGHPHTVACDAVVVCALPAPAFELAKEAGAEVTYTRDAGGFVVRVDTDQRTSALHVWAAGTVAGARDEASARASGRRAGHSAAESLR